MGPCSTFCRARTMIGECYSKVPYDNEMLSTQGAVTKLGDQPYTLPNLLALGGVCAMQADFASRVAKCLGVPAAYVGGENRFGGLHAWVMWVEPEKRHPKRDRIQVGITWPLSR